MLLKCGQQEPGPGVSESFRSAWRDLRLMPGRYFIKTIIQQLMFCFNMCQDLVYRFFPVVFFVKCRFSVKIIILPTRQTISINCLIIMAWAWYKIFVLQIQLKQFLLILVLILQAGELCRCIVIFYIIIMEPAQPLLRILHFNDVYDIQPSDKTNSGGAYYFKEYLDRHYIKDKTLTLFSGDAFSPSVLSYLFEGQQMVECLNRMRIDAACYGNHQFDYELDHTIHLSKKCNFPWLLGNLYDKHLHQPLGEALQGIVLEKNNIKVGVFGVAEEQWLQLLTEQYQTVEYKDFVGYSQQQTTTLKYEKKCDLIIALTHMRVPNDKRLAKQVTQIDFILGGHDHIVLNQKIDKVHVLKSGSNFLNFSVIDFFPKKIGQYQCENFSYNVKLIDCSQPTQQYDKSLKAFVDEKIKIFNQQNDRIVAYTYSPLEIRFQHVRKHQTGYGNFLADLMRKYYNSDGALLHSGAIRIDQYVEVGPMKLSMIRNMFDDAVVVKFIPGDILIQGLENACSKYPVLQGRFANISGISYSFDASKPAGNRVIVESVIVAHQKIDLSRIYKIAMPSYVGRGFDGYDIFKDCDSYIQAQNGIRILALLTRFFKPTSMKKALEEPELKLVRKNSSKVDRMSELAKNIKWIDDRYIIEIDPKADGRVTVVNDFQ